MSTTCHTCPLAVECAALPHGVLGCQDNGARFDAPQAPRDCQPDSPAVLAPYRVTAAANTHGCSRFPCQDVAEFGRCFSAPCPTLEGPAGVFGAIPYADTTRPPLTVEQMEALPDDGGE